MAQYSEVEEDLLAQQEEEEARAAELEEQKQQERLAQQNSPGNQLKDAAVNAAKQYGKKIVKDFAKEEVGSAIVASAPVWAPILGIILVVVFCVFMVIVTIYTACNQSGINGTLARTSSKLSGILYNLGYTLPPDVCSALNSGTTATTTTPTTETKLDIVLTSAYRPGAPSADSRGETVDISLRNPKDPFGSSDPRINQLIAIINTAGFVGPQGYVQNEYANPSPGATGGHIHVQFNLKKDGTTYCDGTKVPNPPTDLVAIPAPIPMEGVSNPKLRPCMLAAVEEVFDLAGVTNFGP